MCKVNVYKNFIRILSLGKKNYNDAIKEVSDILKLKIRDKAMDKSLAFLPKLKTKLENETFQKKLLCFDYKRNCQGEICFY